MEFSLKNMAFSAYGAYMSVTQEPEGALFRIRNCRKPCGSESLAFRFLNEAGNPVEPEVHAAPWAVTLASGSCFAEIIVKDAEEVFIRGKGFTVEFLLDNCWVFQSGENAFHQMLVTPLNSCWEVSAPQGRMIPDIRVTLEGQSHVTHANMRFAGDLNGAFAIGVQCTNDEVHYQPDFAQFDAVLEKNRRHWEAFLENIPAVGQAYRPFATELWYNIWSCTIPAGGNMQYDSVLMSKNVMHMVWSWDHCFNALAVMEGGLPRFALEQFYGIFHCMTPEGKLPDSMNYDAIFRAAVKPPIHGWCFDKLMDKHQFTAAELEMVYSGLEKWTDWHFAYRDNDQDGIPEYAMGCDSGWDNGTLFDIGQSMETPDLPAYLFLQMKTLARIAKTLDWQDKEAYWEDRAKVLLSNFLAHCWENGMPVAKQSGTHRVNRDTQCLLALMPIIIGSYLPKEWADRLVQLLREMHLTEFGLATEAPASPRYISDGYWRGPIWAPSTYLIVDGLRRSGYNDVAKLIATRFCDMVVTNGAYENFDALTGKGLRDRGYTWTSAAALCMMAELEAGLYD